MSRHLFLAAAPAAPSARWLAAFPDGELRTDDETGMAGDVLWLAAEGGWRERLRAAVAAGARVVVVSHTPEEDEALLALTLGARAYCHAAAAPSLLREVGEVVSRGGLWVGPALLGRFLAALNQRLPAAPAQAWSGLLSQREQEVAEAVAGGASNKEVAARLGITERTVKAHLGAVFEKLGVRDRLQLALRMAAGGAVSEAAR